jgi:hypothetical protein
MRAVAYRMQERVLGGLKLATHRLFERVSQDARARRRNESCMTPMTTSTSSPHRHAALHTAQ